jgi:hypothetical protein
VGSGHREEEKERVGLTIERYLSGLVPGDYNPFNLLYGDAGVLHLRMSARTPSG